MYDGGLPLSGRGKSGSVGSRSGPWCSTSTARRQCGGRRPSSNGTRLRPSSDGRRRVPGQRFEGRREVDVLGERVDAHARPDTRTDDDERHPDVGVERGHLAGTQTVLAHVVPVVGAEHEVGVRREAAGTNFTLEGAEHPVDRLHGLHAAPEQAVDGGDRGRREGRMVEPGRVRHAIRVSERGRTRRAHAREPVAVTRRGHEGRVRCEGRDLERERPARAVVVRPRAHDELLREPGEHVGEISRGFHCRNCRAGRSG